MDLTTLKSLQAVYPKYISKYKELLNDPNVDIDTKINCIIQGLNQTNLTFNQLVTNWNQVMQWAMNDGLDQAVITQMNAIVADGQFQTTLNNIVSKEGDLTKLTNPAPDLVTAINGNTSQLADITNEQKEAPVTDLKICFHFNYNTDESKMEDVRNLGFNTVWVYKQANFTKNSTDTLAFLDLLKKHGLKAIMQVDTSVITSGTPTAEQNWITSIEGHEALIGFTHYDEPCGQAVPISNQETAYNNIKAVTHKNVFLVEADSSQTSLYNYYTPNAYDVYLFDLYLDNGSYTTEQAFKTEAVRRILNLRNYTQKFPPKQIIPVFPLFSNPPTFNEPTEQTLKWIMDAWRPFIDGRNYAVFCYDVNGATGYTTLQSSTNLQKLATLIPAYLISAPRTHMRLLPTGYTLSSSFVSATNAKYDNNNFPKIGSSTTTAPVPNTVVVTRLDISQGSKWAILYAAIRQIQDASNRQVSFDISYDNTNWTNLATDTFGAINTGNGYAHAIAITQDVSAIYCRFTLIPTSGTEYSQYWGFTGLGAVSI